LKAIGSEGTWGASFSAQVRYEVNRLGVGRSPFIKLAREAPQTAMLQ
jgi:hypothetical protein